jgi:GTP-binding protein
MQAPTTAEIKASFVASYPNLSITPANTRPEVAFIGRSNVGKSSLINMLLQRRLAQTSGMPGKTQTFNYFAVGPDMHWVDLPGYGYAKRPKTDRLRFGKTIPEFLTHREGLVCTFVLIDIRHPPQKIDVDFMEYLIQSQVPFAMVFTKADKLGPVAMKKALDAYSTYLEERWEALPNRFITSADKKLGRDELLAFIKNLVTEATRAAKEKRTGPAM